MRIDKANYIDNMDCDECANPAWVMISQDRENPDMFVLCYDCAFGLMSVLNDRLKEGENETV